MLELVYRSTVFQTIVVGFVVMGALKLLKPTFIYNQDNTYKSAFVTPEIIALCSAALFYIVKSWLFTSASNIAEPQHKKNGTYKSRHKMRFGRDEFVNNGYGDELLGADEYYN